MTDTTALNVVVIFADQMHRFAMGCMDNPDVLTPTFDRLAETGTMFRSAYSATPVCSPFRVNMLSGRYAMETGANRNCCELPSWCHSLVDDFNTAGYDTSFVGKWHVGGNGNVPIPQRLRMGFQRFIGYQCYNGFYRDVCFYDEDGDEHVFEKHRTDVTMDIALERLSHLGERPFFMTIGFQAPHYPEQPSPRFDHMYRGRTVTPRPNYDGIDPYIPTYSPPSPRPFELCPDFRRYGSDIHEYLRLYYGMVSQIDANVGRFLEALDDRGLSDSTLVLFTSDHGDLAGSHGLNGKCRSYEESAGIPLIMRGPGVPAGNVLDGPIDSSSFVPTCLDLAGIPTRADLASRSRAAMLSGRDDGRPAFADLGDWCMIRQGSVKLTTQGDACTPAMLFDLAKDPYELENLVDSPRHSSLVSQLWAALAEWRAQAVAFREAGEASVS